MMILDCDLIVSYGSTCAEVCGGAHGGGELQLPNICCRGNKVFNRKPVLCFWTATQ